MFAAALHADVFSSYMLSSYTVGKRFDFEVTGERVLKTPAWKADADAPPLPPRKADQLATAKFRQLIPDAKNWKRERIALEDAGDGLHWIYIVEFRQSGTFNGVPPFLKVIVLMDGTVVEPRIREHK
jgi:hypothetical protein